MIVTETQNVGLVGRDDRAAKPEIALPGNNGRDARGRLLPGCRPIPHARGPKKGHNRAEAKAMSEAQITPVRVKHAIIKLFELGMEGDVKALVSFLDRALGKPLVQVESTTTITRKTEIEIRAELRALILRNPRLADIPRLVQDDEPVSDPPRS